MECLAIKQALITDEGLVCIASGCTRLIDVALQECHHITDAGLLTLGTTLRPLRRLTVLSCRQVSEDGKDRVVAARLQMGMGKLMISNDAF